MGREGAHILEAPQSDNGLDAHLLELSRQMTDVLMNGIPPCLLCQQGIITDENSLSLMHQNHLSDVLPVLLSLLYIVGSYAS